MIVYRNRKAWTPLEIKGLLNCFLFFFWAQGSVSLPKKEAKYNCAFSRGPVGAGLYIKHCQFVCTTGMVRSIRYSSTLVESKISNFIFSYRTHRDDTLTYICTHIYFAHSAGKVEDATKFWQLGLVNRTDGCCCCCYAT